MTLSDELINSFNPRMTPMDRIDIRRLVVIIKKHMDSYIRIYKDCPGFKIGNAASYCESIMSEYITRKANIDEYEIELRENEFILSLTWNSIHGINIMWKLK